MAHDFHPSLLRAYDVRGVVSRTLGSADAHALGRSFGTMVRRAGGLRVAVGYDGRLSSPMLESALVDGLNASGIHVLRIGPGPTPMLYHAEAVLDVAGGIQVTGSHNPGDHNGFKLVHHHDALFGDAIAGLGAMAAAGDWIDGVGGSQQIDIMDRYVARLMTGFDGAAYRIGWDAGNGAAGPIVEKLAKLLPGEHHLLFTDVDGNFPNHHPDPAEESNLADLRALVLDKKLDFGVAFDGDGDRIGVIDSLGRVIRGDQLLALFAQVTLRTHPGAAIIGDIKTSQAVLDQIAALGGKPLVAPTGHSLIKSRMKQTGALLAGDISGHLFFGDDYPGYDDALYAAIRLIRAVTLLGRSLAALHDALPVMVNTPELRFPITEERKFAVMADIMQRLRADGVDFEDMDGARVSTPLGWWLLRASNTEAALVARAEARTSTDLAVLIAEIDSRLRESGVIRG